ncbi:hypothetical protein L665_04543 [Ralstonia solanacearum SD54]|nr:hypothetical protein F504_4117 [Ralstonia pseudosolanacearum FQY_4]ANH36059.1 hypothetical protein A3768_5272 [Ralstonia solanacearum]ARU24966.1 hypothetical protein RSSE_p0776 [Ralstonia solanacearum]ESS50398.1 hypothetical protein L665_04543 [Ralstonia solanacearum SD54]
MSGPLLATRDTIGRPAGRPMCIEGRLGDRPGAAGGRPATGGVASLHRQDCRGSAGRPHVTMPPSEHRAHGQETHALMRPARRPREEK